MKKTIIPVIVTITLIIANQALGQVEKGKFLIGSKSGFNAYIKNSKEENTIDGNTTESDGPKTTHFRVTPYAGYFIVDGFVAGLSLDLGFYHSKSEHVLEDGTTATLNSNNTNLLTGPFIRYYLDMEKVKPFAQVEAGWGSDKLVYDRIDYDYSDPFNPKYVIEESELKFSRSKWGIGAGAAFFVTTNVAVDVVVGYKSITSKRRFEDSDNENIDRVGGLELEIGFSIVIP